MMNKYEYFMSESNSIEGEYRLNPGDMEALDYATTRGIYIISDILNIHKLLGDYLKKPWVGKLRTVNVHVGLHVPPNWQELPLRIEEYITNYPQMDSWTAHNEFEKLHPFQDLNGRVGRLIWLSKAVTEGYNFQTGFLQQYYYQTLNKYEKGEIL